MCLRKLPEKEEKAIIAKLPKVFPCWKIIRTSGHCEYDVEKVEPKFMRRTHIAKDQTKKKRAHNYRMTLNYKPAFHAYLTEPWRAGPKKYGMMVVKCWANKADIVRINNYAVAVSKITRK